MRTTNDIRARLGISGVRWCAVLDLILIHVLPSQCRSLPRRAAALQPSPAATASVFSFRSSTCCCSVWASRAQPQPSASSRRKFGAKNAKMIKCWVIALTWMVDNWAVRWREASYHSLYTLHFTLTNINIIIFLSLCTLLSYQIHLLQHWTFCRHDDRWYDWCHWYCIAVRLSGIMWTDENDSTTLSLHSIKHLC